MSSNVTGRSMANFAVTAAELVNASGGNDAYSYDNSPTGTKLADGTQQQVPFVDLTSKNPYSFTDCNGWVNYALNSLAPVHQAIAAAERKIPYFNQTVRENATGSATRTISEGSKPMPRAFVFEKLFADAPALDQTTLSDAGFRNVSDFSTLQAGDMIAWTLGRYTNFKDTTKDWPNDTGHVMIVTGQKELDIALLSADEQAALAETGAQRVVAVSVVDSSSVPHMINVAGSGSDDRRGTGNHYHLTENDTRRAEQLGVQSTTNTPSAGGLGTGTLYFAVDAHGKPIEFQFSELDPFEPLPEAVSIAAARLDTTIDLGKAPNGQPLEVTLMPNRTTTLEGVRYGETEHLTGRGSLLVDGTGTLTLSSENDFTGGIELHGVTLRLAAAGAAGTGAVSTDPDTRNTIDIAAGNAVLDLRGDDTVSAAAGGSVVHGGSKLHFVGVGASTVDGGSGSATITGGAGGRYVGGAAGHNVIQGLGGHSALWGGGTGDQIFGGSGDVLGAAGTGNATLVGGNGNTVVDADGSTAFAGGRTTVFGAAAGSDTIVSGGDLTFVGGRGNTTLFEGNGTATLWSSGSNLVAVAGSGTGTIVAGSGTSTLWINPDSGAQRIVAQSGGGGGSLMVNGFRPGTDSFAATGYGGGATSKVENGSLTVALSDHTSVTFSGLASLE